MMKQTRASAWCAFALLLLAGLALAACGQGAGTIAAPAPSAQAPIGGPATPPEGYSPSVTVNDQTYDGTNVVVAKVVSEGPGWMAIHRQEGGHLGAVIGFTHLNDGENDNVLVAVDPKQATPVMYAMLHVDAGVVGKYEFPGPDVPVMMNGEMLSPAFNATVGPTSSVLPMVAIHDQDVTAGKVVVDQVRSSGPAWLAIHTHNPDGTPGIEIGYVAVRTGATSNLAIPIDAGKATPVLFAMLHIDAGEIGTYEFPGPDVPVLVNGAMIAPTFRATNLAASAAAPSAMPMASTAMSMTAAMTGTVPAAAGAAAPMAASTPVSATMMSPGTMGASTAAAPITPTLAASPTATLAATMAPALAAATRTMTATVAPAMAAMSPAGAAATSTASAPQGMAMAMATPAPGIKPAVKVSDQMITQGIVRVNDVVSSGPGWIVIYTVKDGQPDQPLGHAPVHNGDNPNVAVQIDSAKATGTLYAQLHIDAAKVGTFEYPGPDAPLMIGVQMIAGQFRNLTAAMAQAAPTATPARLPAITVRDQPIHDGQLVVSQVVSTGDEWLVIHRQNPDGSLGDFIGFAAVPDGTSDNVVVRVDTTRTTRGLFAMLHQNVAKAASPQFPGVDVPVIVNGKMVLPEFRITGDLTGDVPITVANDSSGITYLVDGFGLSLYGFLSDTPGKSNCTGDCLKSFRPLLATGRLVPGDGVALAKLGLIVLPDQTRQVTYAGAPLYYFLGDKKPGDIQAQGRDGLWFLVTP